jgi:tetratricopeptide (TPR) repeat protein
MMGEENEQLNAIKALGLFTIGESYFKSGDYDKAIEHYTMVIELDPTLAGAYGMRGIAYEKLGNYQQAIRDYKTAAKLGSKDAQDFLRKLGTDW